MRLTEIGHWSRGLEEGAQKNNRGEQAKSATHSCLYCFNPHKLGN